MIPLIVPAILTDNFATFKETLAKVSPHFSSIQIDVIDGVFLPNKTFSEREDLKDINSEAYFELHLMVKNPIAEITTWENNDNVTNVVFHIEADVYPSEMPQSGNSVSTELFHRVNVEECIKLIRQNNWKVGIALNPETPIAKIMPYVNLVDEVLFMTVHPGQQGAAFVPEVLEKIKEFKKLGLSVIISADGGINKNTIKDVVAAGAEKLYIGGAITRAEDVETAHEELINVEL